MADKELSEVAANRIWREAIKKEMSHAQIQSRFNLSSGSLSYVTEKPTEKEFPQDYEDAVSSLGATEEEKAIFKERTPRERYQKQMLSSHEYGWFSQPLKKGNPRFRHPLASCDITKYADAYHQVADKLKSPSEKK